MKIKDILLLSTGLFSLITTAFAEAPFYLKAKPGLSLSQFNGLAITRKKMKLKAGKMKKTSFGVMEVSRGIEKKPFRVRTKKQDLWKQGVAEFNKKKVHSFSVFNEESDAETSGRIFYTLSQYLGDNFTPYAFRSFGKTGVAFEWQVNKMVYTLKVSKMAGDQWSNHLKVEKMSPVHKKAKPLLDLSSPNAVAVIGPIMGFEEDFDTFASDAF